jgi:hypothetical protein
MQLMIHFPCFLIVISALFLLTSASEAIKNMISSDPFDCAKTVALIKETGTPSNEDMRSCVLFATGLSSTEALKCICLEFNYTGKKLNEFYEHAFRYVIHKRHQEKYVLEAFGRIKVFLDDLHVKPSLGDLDTLVNFMNVGTRLHIDPKQFFMMILKHSGPLKSYTLARLEDSQFFLELIDYLPDIEINRKTDWGTTLLYSAVKLSDAQIAYLASDKLLQRGANPNLEVIWHSQDYRTRDYSNALKQALDLKRYAIATLLIRKGALVDEFVRKGLDHEALDFLDRIMPVFELMLAIRNSNRID